MNEKKEKQFETKFAMAVTLFANQLQDVTQNSVEDLSESIVKKFESDPSMSIEEMTKEIADYIVKALIEEFELKVINDEAKS